MAEPETLTPETGSGTPSVRVGRAAPVSSRTTESPEMNTVEEPSRVQLGLLARSQAPETAPVQVTVSAERVTGMVSVSAPEPTATE